MTTKLRTQTAVPNQPDRILRPRQLADRIGPSLATLWRLRRSGDLPEPIRLSPGCVGWRTSEIDAWLTARAERRR
jgi:prophage regulatory protein